MHRTRGPWVIECHVGDGPESLWTMRTGKTWRLATHTATGRLCLYQTKREALRMAKHALGAPGNPPVWRVEAWSRSDLCEGKPIPDRDAR